MFNLNVTRPLNELPVGNKFREHIKWCHRREVWLGDEPNTVEFSRFSSLSGEENFPGGSVVKNPPAMQETLEMQVWSPGQEDLLEEGVAAHSSVLAWRIPWTEATVHGVTRSLTQPKGLSTFVFTQYAHFCPGATAEVKSPAHPQRAWVLVGGSFHWLWRQKRIKFWCNHLCYRTEKVTGYLKDHLFTVKWTWWKCQDDCFWKSLWGTHGTMHEKHLAGWFGSRQTSNTFSFLFPRSILLFIKAWKPQSVGEWPLFPGDHSWGDKSHHSCQLH